MEQRIKDLFHKSVLQQAMRRYAILENEIAEIDAYESFIYEFQRGVSQFVLRISHSSRRSEDLIKAEVDWINYLAAGGVSVARAINSEAGNLVEAVADGQGGSFLATAFVKAQGRVPWEAGWTPERYQTYGELLGKMHALAEQYQPLDNRIKRPDWDDPMFDFVNRYLPASESIAKQKYQAVYKQIQAFPKDKDAYGLIHQDVHQTNFLMDDAGLITLYDFDECAYGWFINDIAIVLFHSSVEEEQPAFTQMFMPLFLQGYRKFHRLDPKWLKTLPLFLKLREIELYAVIHRDFDVNDVDDEWLALFMRNRKASIENDLPFINFDFEQLAEFL